MEDPFDFNVEIEEEEKNKDKYSSNQEKLELPEDKPLPPKYWPEEIFHQKENDSPSEVASESTSEKIKYQEAKYQPTSSGEEDEESLVQSSVTHNHKRNKQSNDKDHLDKVNQGITASIEAQEGIKVEASDEHAFVVQSSESFLSDAEFQLGGEDGYNDESIYRRLINKMPFLNKRDEGFDKFRLDQDGDVKIAEEAFEESVEHKTIVSSPTTEKGITTSIDEYGKTLYNEEDGSEEELSVEVKTIDGNFKVSESSKKKSQKPKKKRGGRRESKYKKRRKEEKEAAAKENAKQKKERLKRAKEQKIRNKQIQAVRKSRTKSKGTNKESKDVFASIKKSYNKRRLIREQKMQKDVVGLHIGASSIKAVILDSDNPIIYRVNLPKGIISDGSLKDPEQFSRALRELWRQSSLKSKKVNFSIDNSQIIMKVKEINAKKSADINRALSVNADILFSPLDPKDLRMDYATLTKSSQASTLQVVAVDKELVSEYSSAIEKAGLMAVNCESGSIVASRAFRIPRSPSSVHMIIDIGAETTSVSMCSGPDVLFLKTIDVGGNDFTSAIQQEVGCSWEDAEKIKILSGLGYTDKVSQDALNKSHKALNLITDQLTRRILSIHKFYESSEDSKPVSGWSTIGGGSRLAGLSEKLSMSLSLGEPVLLTPYPGLERIPDLDINCTAIGLARGSQMNLIPEASAQSNIKTIFNKRKSKIAIEDASSGGLINKQKKEINFKLIGIMLSALIISGGFLFMVKTKEKNENIQSEISSVQSKLESTFGPKPAIEFTNSKKGSEISQRISETPSISQLSQVVKIIEAVPLDNVSFKTTGVELNIKGEYSKKSKINKVLKEIQAIPGLEDSQLQKNKSIGRFEIISILQTTVQDKEEGASVSG